ncbi:MAG TPA: M23 family metallopeptidase [Solirubrobacterales bacterium]|nr:M23 family metallopeptidase [Solirubrobacterales bacterium]
MALALICTSATAVAAAPKASEGGLSAGPAPAPVVPVTPGTQSRAVYPIRGAHEYWDGMGAGRGHDGVDIGSPCGTPLVAVQAGRVSFAKYHARAGNYVVIDLKASTIDIAYMHLREPASVLVGQSVAAGTPLGFVGDTGNASGCHLHFEVWEGAYYGGGAPIDPMPFLTAWERTRKRVR